ncbi:hypothetical protein NDU88_005649 [Pleurodeles waltl]|uniref:Uncharacterized protein n=1 Tax=Pleurodeles waltl TaxID=8319 RepID=A0AAV7MAL5_PLEWA|nr:hypothetical protein NDU88_005649 [Pleurodeles waltl]
MRVANWNVRNKSDPILRLAAGHATLCASPQFARSLFASVQKTNSQLASGCRKLRLPSKLLAGAAEHSRKHTRTLWKHFLAHDDDITARKLTNTPGRRAQQ